MLLGHLNLAKGALEVWIVEETGKTRYFSYEGELNDSSTIQGVRNGN